jgi:hypothetical protein
MKMKTLALALLLALTLALPLGAATFGVNSAPATTNNDDSCDVGNYPAATLLLPYFEVDLTSTSGETTIFSVTNTAAMPQAARVTLWTNYAYPIIAFNLYLTGYDVQKINLFDVIRRGVIAPDTEMGANDAPLGELSDDDNPRLDEDTCVNLPQTLPQIIITRMQSAFTTGKVPGLGTVPACNMAGGSHTNAIGYATIDVVGVCTGSMPTENSYFTHEIRFDNVLMGDYIQVNGDHNFAQAAPMVHIRAIPEGGQLSTRRKTHLPRTFYSRYQPAANNTADARQPLPSTWAARWIAGSQGGFETFMKIWRESRTTDETVCSAYPVAGGVTEIDAVRFDEEENPEAFGACNLCNPPMVSRPILPSTSITHIENEAIFPSNTQGAVAGWIYLNLHNRLPNDLSVAGQSWVIASMRAEERFSVDVESAALGNGCSPAVRGGDNRPIIAPAPNVTP